MKRLVLVLTISLAMHAMKGQGLEIAVYTEPQLAWITSDEGGVIANGSLVHLNTGIEFDIFFMPNYALSVGLNLNNQGGKVIYRDTTAFQLTNETVIVHPDAELSHNLQYVGIPVGLKLKAEEMGYTTIYFHAGLNPLLNIRALASSDNPALVKENIKPEINKFSLNYFIEAGIEYRLAGNTALIFGFKWSAGFNDVTLNDFANTNLSSAGLHLGILF